MNAHEPNRARRTTEEAEKENRDADTAPGPQGDNLPSDAPHQVAEEELNPHFGPLRRPSRARGD